MTILIPAFEPDKRLIKLVEQIQSSLGFEIVIVDDGSGPAYREIFDAVREMGCVILTHHENRGKGCALKTGFEYISRGRETIGVVTADADGQHLICDIRRVAAEVRPAQRKIILGVRKFIGRVPLRSVIGNRATSAVFALASGVGLLDTQTGLRGFPILALPWLLTVEGERFEYEMNMLLDACTSGYSLEQVVIDTVYIAGNRSSHFRPLTDSLRVLAPLLRFSVSGLSAAAVDYSLLFVFQALTNNLFLSVAGARIASSAVNYSINRSVVFKSKPERIKTRAQILKYYILVTFLLICNYLCLLLFTRIFGLWLFWSKILTEVLLFTISYSAQRFYVFRHVSPS